MKVTTRVQGELMRGRTEKREAAQPVVCVRLKANGEPSLGYWDSKRFGTTLAAAEWVALHYKRNPSLKSPYQITDTSKSPDEVVIVRPEDFKTQA